MTRACYWVKDREVPGGKFLVPGCLNRAVHGEYAECNCETGKPKKRGWDSDRLEILSKRVMALEQRVGQLLMERDDLETQLKGGFRLKRTPAVKPDTAKTEERG